MINEVSLDSKLKYYLFLLQKKRRKVQLEEMLLAIILHKDKTQSIKEAIEKSDINRKTKEELIDWIVCGELKDEREGDE